MDIFNAPVTLAVEDIIDTGWDSSRYMMHDHTMKHMRDS